MILREKWNLRGFDTINRRNAGNLVYVDGFLVALIRHLTSIHILDAQRQFSRNRYKEPLPSITSGQIQVDFFPRLFIFERLEIIYYR